LKAAIRDNDPVIFMESEQMYGDKVVDGEYTIPLELISNEGTDVTIVSLKKSSKKRTLLLTNWLKAFHVKLSI
jgi:pyruvate dehydrogenase E1 component beta subunit